MYPYSTIHFTSLNQDYRFRGLKYNKVTKYNIMNDHTISFFFLSHTIVIVLILQYRIQVSLLIR